MKKRVVIEGLIWKILEKAGVQGLQFCIGIVLARLLSPNEFGLMAMLTIFFNVSQVIVGGGLDKALIRNKNRTKLDYSTVFTFNVVMSIIMYLVLYVTSPYVALFYDLPELSIILKCLSLNVILTALSFVPITKLTIKFDFRVITQVNFISTLCAGVVAILLALNNFGIWALITQLLLKSVITFALFLIGLKWDFALRFSKSSFKSLFQYGYKLGIAGIYSHFINSLYSVLLGKAYAAIQLGFYNRAKNITELTSDVLNQTINQVSFPLFAQKQEDTQELLSVFRKVLTVSAFVSFPLMTLISVLADPIIKLLFNEQWYFTIPLLKWMPFVRILYPINALNMNMLSVIGRSDLYLKIDILKFPIIIIPMLIAFTISVKALIIGQIIASFLSFFVNTYYTNRFYSYGAFSQFIDLMPTVTATILMAVAVHYSIGCFNSLILKIIVGSLLGCAVYFIIGLTIRSESIQIIHGIIKDYKHKKIK